MPQMLLVTNHFSARFQKDYKSIWTRSSKGTSCIQGARKFLWKEPTYKLHNLTMLSKFWGKKSNTDLYTCFEHLPKCKAIVNQVTAICMLISILSCYRRVQEESWKAFNVLSSIASQHVIIAKPSLLFFPPSNRFRRMQMVFLIVHEMSLNFPFTLEFVLLIRCLAPSRQM